MGGAAQGQGHNDAVLRLVSNIKHAKSDLDRKTEVAFSRKSWVRSR
jgi:hypothetical protein